MTRTRLWRKGASLIDQPPRGNRSRYPSIPLQYLLFYTYRQHFREEAAADTQTHTHTHSESGAAYKGEVSGGVAGATVSFPQEEEEEEGAHLSGVVEATRAAAVAAVAKRRKETLSKAQWLTVQRARNPEKEYARRRRTAGLGLGISRAAEVHTGWTRDR